jgi:hypothetical protein
VQLLETSVHYYTVNRLDVTVSLPERRRGDL